MADLQAQPEPPSTVTEVADDDAPIIPITCHFVAGDVMYGGLDAHELIDMGHGGEHDLVFDSISGDVNRFAVHHKEGPNFVLGWLYRDPTDDTSPSWNGLKVHLRDDVQAAYSHDNYPDDPTDIHKRYDAY